MAKVHPHDGNFDSPAAVEAENSRQYVFRRLFSHGLSDLSEAIDGNRNVRRRPSEMRHGETIPTRRADENSTRRRSFEDNMVRRAEEGLGSTTRRRSFEDIQLLGGIHEHSETEYLELLFNQVSATTNELRSGEELAWMEFSALSEKAYNFLLTNAPSGSLFKVLTESGYSLEFGWVKDGTDIDALFQALGNLYLAEQSKHEHVHETHINIKNIQTLTFCPNVLFANFPHKFDSTPCSTSFDGAVMMADISGFSKFAGEMTLRGAKGLDSLHKVTSDFLGHFVHTVYEYDGDGKFYYYYFFFKPQHKKLLLNLFLKCLHCLDKMRQLIKNNSDF